MDYAKIFEAIMLVCFGAAWPISILKLYKAKAALGKSRLFLVIIMIGYMSGICYKVTGRMDGVIVLYIINLIMVFIDFLLCCRYKKDHVLETTKK